MRQEGTKKSQREQPRDTLQPQKPINTAEQSYTTLFRQQPKAKASLTDRAKTARLSEKSKHVGETGDDASYSARWKEEVETPQEGTNPNSKPANKLTTQKKEVHASSITQTDLRQHAKKRRGFRRSKTNRRRRGRKNIAGRPFSPRVLKPQPNSSRDAEKRKKSINGIER